MRRLLLKRRAKVKKPLSDDVQKYLRRRKLCFTCQESWAPRHRCVAGKASDDEEEEDEEIERGHDAGITGDYPPPPGS